MRYFRIWLRPGAGVKNDISKICLLENVILLGWNEIKLNLKKSFDSEWLREKVRKHYASGYIAGQFVAFFKTFEDDCHSLVLVPSLNEICYAARIAGPVEWREIDGNHYYCRSVRWVGRCRRADLSKALQKKISTRQTCREIKDEGCKNEIAKLVRMMEEANGEPPDEFRNKGNSRKPADLRILLNSYEYMIKGGKRRAFRPHKDFQLRLERYLENVGISNSKAELDYVDVTFSYAKQPFIGEVKVTNGYINSRQAFRAALGQVLEYRFTRHWKAAPNMIIFLDQKVDAARLELAAQLKISVVVEAVNGTFQLANSYGADVLSSIFPSSP